MKKKSVKQIVKSLLPIPIRQAVRKYRSRKRYEKYKGLTTQQVFAKVHEHGVWGKSDDPASRIYSGSGSHDKNIVLPYIQAVQNYLLSFDTRPNVVDLGCGDFYVGSRIRAFCGSYTACDIVPDLISYNREKYSDLNVDFRILNLTKDELPKANIVFIRQVLQHLSNHQIMHALPRRASHYEFMVITEHLPSTKNFTPNLDHPAVPNIRLSIDSGIVLTMPPFCLRAKDERLLCEMPEYGGLIRTVAYRLQ